MGPNVEIQQRAAMTVARYERKLWLRRMAVHGAVLAAVVWLVHIAFR